MKSTESRKGNPEDTETYFKELWAKVEEHGKVGTSMAEIVLDNFQTSQTPTHTTQASSIFCRSSRFQTYLEQAYHIYLFFQSSEHVQSEDSHRHTSSDHVYPRNTDEEYKNHCS